MFYDLNYEYSKKFLFSIECAVLHSSRGFSKQSCKMYKKIHIRFDTMLTKEASAMDENAIRKVLTSYLRANNAKVRIFKEKSIGGSICDLMAVTDIISGYEIKSDLDNYSRLDSQVISYNKFFNKNYAVV